MSYVSRANAFFFVGAGVNISKFRILDSYKLNSCRTDFTSDFYRNSHSHLCFLVLLHKSDFPHESSLLVFYLSRTRVLLKYIFFLMYWSNFSTKNLGNVLMACMIV
jgi:hypothetical protein